MKLKSLFAVLAISLIALVSFSHDAKAEAKAPKSLYLVVGSNGPGFTAPKDAVNMLEGMVVPGLEQMAKMAADKRILAGGVSAGGRGGVMIIEASSVDEADRIIHSFALWPLLDWQVTPLQSFETRAAMEKENLAAMKKMMSR